MIYKIQFAKSAAKDLLKIPKDDQQRILIKVHQLSQQPRIQGCKKLKNRVGYRVRVGTYRIIYDIMDRQLVIQVIAIGQRKDIYD